MTSYPRFFVEEKNIFKDKFYIDNKGDINKIRQVLRLEKGAKILMFDGIGNEHIGEIAVLRKDLISGEISEHIKVEIPKKPHIILAQALTRTTKIDDIVRMNTEIGVEEFVFFESEYSIVKLKDFRENKIDRWQTMAIESAGQCERVSIPEIHAPISFAELLTAEADKKLMLHSRKTENSINLNMLKDVVANSKLTIIVIGPEGGFSPDEIQKGKTAGFEIVYLETPILRTETAGIVANSILLS